MCLSAGHFWKSCLLVCVVLCCCVSKLSCIWETIHVWLLICKSNIHVYTHVHVLTCIYITATIIVSFLVSLPPSILWPLTYAKGHTCTCAKKCISMYSCRVLTQIHSLGPRPLRAPARKRVWWLLKELLVVLTQHVRILGNPIRMLGFEKWCDSKWPLKWRPVPVPWSTCVYTWSILAHIWEWDYSSWAHDSYAIVRNLRNP